MICGAAYELGLSPTCWGVLPLNIIECFWTVTWTETPEDAPVQLLDISQCSGDLDPAAHGDLMIRWC